MSEDSLINLIDAGSRGARIDHRERLKKKRSAYLVAVKEDKHQIARLIDTPKPCSCYLCGNPRTHFGETTIQEKSAIEIYRHNID